MFSVDQSYRQSQRLIEASRVINQIENRLKTIGDEVNQVYAGQDAFILDTFVQKLSIELSQLERDTQSLGWTIENEAAALQRELEEEARRKSQQKKSGTALWGR